MSNTFAVGHDVKRSVCTLILPLAHLQRLEDIKQRTGIPRNTIAALALDEYFQRHYPAGEQAHAAERATNDHGALP